MQFLRYVSLFSAKARKGDLSGTAQQLSPPSWEHGEKRCRKTRELGPEADWGSSLCPVTMACDLGQVNERLDCLGFLTGFLRGLSQLTNAKCSCCSWLKCSGRCSRRRLIQFITLLHRCQGVLCFLEECIYKTKTVDLFYAL